MRKYNNREKNKIEVLRDVIKDLEYQRDNFSKLPNQAKAIQLAINREKKRVDWLQGIINKSDKYKSEEFSKTGFIVYSDYSSTDFPVEGSLVVYRDIVYNLRNIDTNDKEPILSAADKGHGTISIPLRDVSSEIMEIIIIDANDKEPVVLDKKQWQKAINEGYVNQDKPVNYKTISISEKKEDGDTYKVNFAVVKLQEEHSPEEEVYNNLAKALEGVKDTKYCDSELEEKLNDVLTQVKNGAEGE